VVEFKIEFKRRRSSPEPVKRDLVAMAVMPDKPEPKMVVEVA
jgi:hypothetical protein